MRYEQINEKSNLSDFDTRQALFHGSDAEFNKFDQSFLRSAKHFYTSPDPKTAKFYGENVYLCHGRGQRADLIHDHTLLLKLAEEFKEDFMDEAVTALESDSFPHEVIAAKAKEICYDQITGGSLYDFDSKGSLQNAILDTVFSWGYESVKLRDYSHSGASISIVFESADDVQIVRKVEPSEFSQHHFDLDESIENPQKTDFPAILMALKKDPTTAGAFKTSGAELDPEAMLKTMRRLMFNNHEVRKMLDGAVQYKYLLKPGREPDVESLKFILKEFAKRVSGAKRHSLSARAKKELRAYIESMGNSNRPSQATIDEIMSIPSMRPTHPVVLYRGMMFQRQSWNASKVEDQMSPFLSAIRGGKRSLTLPQDSMSSWTHSPAVAERFARYRANYGQMDGFMSHMSRSAEKRWIDGDLGVVVQLIARPEDILVDTTLVDLGYDGGGYQESEVILRPGAKLVRIFAAYNQQGPLDLTGAVSEESETERKIKEVVSAAQMVDIQTTFVKPMWSGSLDWHFERMEYAREKRDLLVRKAQTLYDEINPAAETIDVRTLDPTTVSPKDMDKLTALKHLATYMKSMREYEGNAEKYIQNASLPKGRYGGRGSDGDFFEANRQSLYKMAMELEGKQVHYRDRIPVYHRLKPVNQENLLGGLVDHYIELSGSERPDTWEKRVDVAYKAVKDVRAFNGLASWYMGVIDSLKSLEGH